VKDVGRIRRGGASYHPCGLKVYFHIVAGIAVALANAPAVALDVTVVSTCPQQQHIPVAFKVDCSYLKDAATKALCGPFADNQACKVFPAYRKITNIYVEQLCPTIIYTIYDRDNWPNVGAGGGISIECRIDYLAEYALVPHAKSAIGPYEVHEILHQYQMADETLAELTAFHPLFSSSMLEAEREVGDTQAYELGITRMKDDIGSLRTALDQATIAPANRCRMAQIVIEKNLYLHNAKNVYQFYRRLANGPVRNATSRLSAMLNTLAGGTAKQFLRAHGCEAF
jgi:hypothetical protein